MLSLLFLSFFLSFFISISFLFPPTLSLFHSFDGKATTRRPRVGHFGYRFASRVGHLGNRLESIENPTRSRGKFKRRYEWWKFNCAWSSPLSREVRAKIQTCQPSFPHNLIMSRGGEFARTRAHVLSAVWKRDSEFFLPLFFTPSLFSPPFLASCTPLFHLIFWMTPPLSYSLSSSLLFFFILSQFKCMRTHTHTQHMHKHTYIDTYTFSSRPSTFWIP